MYGLKVPAKRSPGQAVVWQNPGMLKIRATLFLLAIVCGKAWSLDQFEGMKCGADIPKFLVGKTRLL